MPAADEDGGLRCFERFEDVAPTLPIELGGPIHEHALPDHGRLVVQRVGITLEGSTVAIATGPHNVDPSPPIRTRNGRPRDA